MQCSSTPRACDGSVRVIHLNAQPNLGTTLLQDPPVCTIEISTKAPPPKIKGPAMAWDAEVVKSKIA